MYASKVVMDILHGFQGFWMDIGQPKDFITGTSLYLNHVKLTSPDRLAKGENFSGPVLVVCILDNLLPSDGHSAVICSIVLIYSWYAVNVDYYTFPFC